jgi:hypothetical protein
MNKKLKKWLFALFVLLLLLISWFASGSKWLSFGLKDMAVTGTSAKITMDRPNDLVAASMENGRKSARNPAGKAKSILNIKSGETGIFLMNSISSGNILEQFDGSKIDDVPICPILLGFATKAVLLSSFEQAYIDHKALSVRVSDEEVIEYSEKDLRVRVEIVEKRESAEDLRVDIRYKESKSNSELTIYPGHGMVFRLPEPELGLLIVYRGMNEDDSTSKSEEDSK